MRATAIARCESCPHPGKKPKPIGFWDNAVGGGTIYECDNKDCPIKNELDKIAQAAVVAMARRRADYKSHGRR